jgi:hypothetical protein
VVDPALFDEINAWIPEVIAASLARDLEKQLKVMLGATSANPEPVTRENSALQARVVQHTRRRLDVLEQRLVRLSQTSHSGAEPDSGV